MNNNKREIEENTKDSKNVGKLFFFIVIGFFVLVILRFFYVSNFHHANGVNLRQKVEQLYAKRTEVKAKRGTIYDANKQVIAEDTTTYSVYVVLSKQARTYDGKPAYLKDSDKDKAAKVLSENLGASYSQIRKTLSPKDPNIYQVELGSEGKNISLETKKRIEAANISGIEFTPSQARLYPNGTFASHLIGIAESENNKLVGIMGLEKQYNKDLSGKNGVKSEQTDGQGTKLPWTSSVAKKVKNGDNIYTTLDSHLQNYLENLLTKAQETYKPKSINAVLMNAKTGEIIAASQRPTFNAQTKVGINSAWTNNLTESTYEPGSCMKIFLMAAAINSGIYNPNATFESGKYNIDGAYVYDWKRSGWGTLTYRQAFIRSSNVGMAHLEQQMGAKRWLRYLKSFGFLKAVNSPGLGNEAKGYIGYEYPIDQANTAYGQSIDVTVMQMMQGLTAIANNGTMVQPRFIKKIVDPNSGKTVYKSKKKVVGHPITASTAKQVRSMMQDVITDKDGTGQAYKIDGYDIGVKTGTAQIANSTGSGYLTGEKNYIFSVAGIAPLNDPKYVLYITMQQPETFGSEGSATKMLATIFNPMMKQTLQDDTTGENDSSTNKVPNVEGLSVETAQKELQKTNADVIVCGNGVKIDKQSVAEGQTVLSGSKIILVTNGTKTIPDLTGWSRNDVKTLADMLGIKVHFDGSGFVKSQSISANTVVKKDQQLNIALQ
ncbi:penicillin-binding protein [Ligilactobacillus cholophilus]|uniref:penicillin-binding protein n=1 Tax=Ligilactobacillus cholophilus TaxID=3050131 RepID=UPI0025B13D64|nr:penicillin-binding protein [Ligilactobacillus cholophilus]